MMAEDGLDKLLLSRGAGRSKAGCPIWWARTVAYSVMGYGSRARIMGYGLWVMDD